MAEPLLQVQDLHTRFTTPTGVVHAVRGVSFAVRRGETVGLVGESGSGKSVTALSIMRLLPEPPARIRAGRVLLDGEDLLGLPPRAMQDVRGRRIAMVFQDPFASLNPTMRLGDQVAEAIQAHGRVSRREALARSLDLFRAVHLPAPEARLHQYPHQVSGGQRQRVMIAMAFALRPDVLIADEPTTALDVTVQAQIMALMSEFQERTGAAILLITHDLGLVAEMCDRVLVMYAWQIVEEGSARQVFHSPRHPYTVGLLESLPQLHEERASRLRSIPGQPPDLADLPTGCAFADRCPRVMEVCRREAPPVHSAGQGSWARCHLLAETPPLPSAGSRAPGGAQ